MTNGELAFLALAEELNFTRAADRIYMSQQGLSDHIKRLEQEYNTKLVVRKPHVELTQSGEALYKMLNQKAAMEKDIKRLIIDLNHGEAGDVYVGISSSRVRVLTSDLVQTYYESHPGVRVHVESGLTADLVQALIQGELDCVIGKNVTGNKELVVEQMFSDPVYIALPEDVAKKHFGDAKKARIEDCADLKFIRGRHEQAQLDVIDDFTARKGITLNNIVSVPDFNVQAALCIRLKAAMFCSKSFAFFPGGEIMRKHLRIMEIEGLTLQDEISLVTKKDRTYPACVEEFLDTIRQSLDEFYNKAIANK